MRVAVGTDHAGLPLKQLIGRDGKILPATFGETPFYSVDPDAAQRAHDEIAGLYVNQAKKRTAELLAVHAQLQDPAFWAPVCRDIEDGPREFTERFAALAGSWEDDRPAADIVRDIEDNRIDAERPEMT